MHSIHCNDRHALLGIHCVIASKDQELYTAITSMMHSLIPDSYQKSLFLAGTSIDKFMKEIYPALFRMLVPLYFFLGQISKAQARLNFHGNPETVKFMIDLIPIPFLPASLILQPIHSSKYRILQIRIM